MALKRTDIILDKLQGKECYIHNLNISSALNSHTLTVKMHIETTESNVILTMHNANNIKMNFCSSAFSIEGFEIIDNVTKGWSKEVRYCLNDFENGVIKLYFERYEITPYENDSDNISHLPDSF